MTSAFDNRKGPLFIRACLPSNILTQTYHFLPLRCCRVFVLNMERSGLLLLLTPAVHVLSFCLDSEQMIIRPHQTVYPGLFCHNILYLPYMEYTVGSKSLQPPCFYFVFFGNLIYFYYTLYYLHDNFSEKLSNVQYMNLRILWYFPPFVLITEHIPAGMDFSSLCKTLCYPSKIWISKCLQWKGMLS